MYDQQAQAAHKGARWLPPPLPPQQQQQQQQ
jgi:hypothetical protein